ncbi:hypothetical protein DMC30DRAFT_444565 [Rhodotorula diobovata]|uniref:Uncharacterized protein n=1 Tax=Rhodotorula diobovata TaxID=5288 RepID=A0A5C5G2M9_9BASI|nr:hypothetical protein DMC30DRAFT_444565 [Rhodotorula diobovata]
MSSPSTVYFITGAGRGIGLGLTSTLAARPDVLVFAGARAPEKADALNALAKETGRVVVVKIDTTSDEDHKAAAELVKEKAGRVDVVIANAGIAEGWGPIATAPLDLYTRHFETNVVGPLRLYQSLAPLLQASTKPQFLGMSSTIGSNTLRIPMLTAPYGVSKAALSHLVVKMHVEGEKDNLTAWVTHPGLVGSDMGAEAARQVKEALGVDVPTITVEESVTGLLKLIDNATRESVGGKFVQYDGAELPW